MAAELSPSLTKTIASYAVGGYPYEVGGLIVDGTVNGRVIDGDFVPVPNIHPEPERAFRAPKEVYLEYSGRITALFHSHPDGPAAPSAADMQTQASFGVPSIIASCNAQACWDIFAFGDQLERLPLEGRPFRHAVSDCYEAARDWYLAEKGIRLPSVPRDWGWWKQGLDLYQEGFAKNGFRRLSPEEHPQHGDGWFVCIGSEVPNHGGIYLDNGLIFHHLGSARHGAYSPTHLSVVEYGLRWTSFRPIFVRHRAFEQ